MRVNKGIVCGVTFQPNISWDDTRYIGSPKIEPSGFASVIDEVLDSSTKNLNGTMHFYYGSSSVSSTFIYGDVRIELLTGVSESADSMARRVRSRPVAGLQEFFDTFGPAEVVAIWWFRKDGCHDR
jgi:hypothetical protein